MMTDFDELKIEDFTYHTHINYISSSYVNVNIPSLSIWLFFCFNIILSVSVSFGLDGFFFLVEGR